MEKNKENKEIVVTDLDIENQKSSTSVERDDHNKIKSYSFNILIRDKSPLMGVFTREEMNNIYKLYSSYGASISQRELSRQFPEYSLIDFKRILRAFNITKASSPFAPHMIEEYTEEQLTDIALRQKDDLVLRKIEEARIRHNEKLVKDLLTENNELKNSHSAIEQSICNFINSESLPFNIVTDRKISYKNDRTLVLYLADLHIGAKVSLHSLYGNDYNYKVIEERLKYLVKNLPVGFFDTIIVNMMGDMMDGMNNSTTRGGHFLPQNMDNYEQIDSYLELMENFIVSIRDLYPTTKVVVQSVKCGNHDGHIAYAATLGLFAKLTKCYDDIECNLFKDFYGIYEVGEHFFAITHGKDDLFMKRGLPLNLDPASKNKINDWLNYIDAPKKNVHIVKADLHSSNFNSCYRFDYRNVLSMFGASDHSQMNYDRNNSGTCYDVIETNGQIMRGTIINE